MNYLAAHHQGIFKLKHRHRRGLPPIRRLRIPELELRPNPPKVRAAMG
jgi:hypothetical protein